MRLYRYCDFKELEQLVETGKVLPYKTQSNILPIYFNVEKGPIQVCLNIFRSQLEEDNRKLYTLKGYNLSDVKWVKYEGRIGCPQEILKYLELKLDYKNKRNTL